MKRTAKFLLLFITIFAFALISSSEVMGSAEKARVFVQFEPGKKAQVKDALQKAGSEFHYEFDELNTFVVTLPQQALSGIANNPNVVLIEEDAPRYPDMRGFTPPAEAALSPAAAAGQVTPYGIDAVQARQVWAEDVTGAGRLVCIIDSGLYTAHEDMAGVNVVGGYPSGWNTDFCGHGTHVAGTIAAADNDLGVVGVTPGAASLYIVKVFGDNCGWSYSSTLVDASNRCEAAGADIISMSLGGSIKSRTEETNFQRLFNNGILSVAAAGNDGSTRLSYPASYSSVISVAATDENNLVADFSQKNSAVELAAPGVGVLSTVPWLSDTSVTVDGVTYSANHIENAKYGGASGDLVDGGLCSSTGSWSGKVVLCERGSISFYDKVRNVQNGGGAAAVIYNNEPGNFLGTLGDGYTSTIPAVSLSQEDGQYLVANKLGRTAAVNSSISIPDSGYEAWDGTSMATPHVSGVAALIWSADGSWTNVEIREALQQTALDLGAAGKDNSYGYGLVQAYDAFQFLGGVTPPPPPPGDLVVSLSTDKPGYANRETVAITALVTDETNPVSGAAVAIEILSPSGKKVAGSGTTAADGTVIFTWKVNSKSHGVGTYTVSAVASKDGYNPGSGSTTFEVTN